MEPGIRKDPEECRESGYCERYRIDTPAMTITTRSAIWLSSLCWLGLAGLAHAAEPAIKTKPGELVIDPPTLINLGFEWLIEGDDNRNAAVEVSYRRRAESQWQAGPAAAAPARRAHLSERTACSMSSRPTCSRAAFWIWNRTPPTKPGSRCPIRMVSPAKPARQWSKPSTVRTRPEPKPYSGGRVFHVYPPNYTGTKDRTRI